MSIGKRTVELMDPRGNPHVGDKRISARLEDLNGKVVGLLNNGKPHFDLFLADLESRLRAAYPSIRIVQRTKPVVPRPAPQDMMTELVDECDALVTGIGD